jgi:hypothetical protein
MNALALAAALAAAPAPQAGSLPREALQETAAALVRTHGEAQRARIERGVAQAASLWRASDGDAKAFRAFAEANFTAGEKDLDVLLGRFEEALEQVNGAILEVDRALRRRADLDLGPMLEVDRLFAAMEFGAHEVDDLFDGKLAFAALLNFPLTTLAERLEKGPSWSRREWAAVRLAGTFARRVPAQVEQDIARADAAARLYIADYNLYAHHLVEGDAAAPRRLFPKGMRLLSHWNLRDQIKADYAGGKGGLARQRALQKAMERIVDQTIPAAAVNDPAVDWNPFTNQVWPSPAAEIEGGARPPARADPAREADRRYAVLLASFRAAREADPYSPIAPTLVARKFELEREIPEARVEAMLGQVLDSPLLPRLARLVERRLGRKLEPFDIWYDGFRPRSRHGEGELDALTRRRYPDAAAFERDLPRILERLGFSPEKARFLADHIAVDPARGSGHALEARRRGDKPHLRTRVGADGMDYKGYNIAIHELGHNVEQVFSLYEVDSTLLQGVPNNAFTEALAFVFQARDLEVLGLPGADAAERRLLALSDLWAAAEISGVSLVDMGVWRWMYQHPEAGPAELREATLRICREVWNAHFARLFGVRDSTLLGIYSHMIDERLYLPDYAIAHMIQAQVEERLGGAASLGSEFERVARFGAVAPDLWMRNATGEPVSPAALLRAAEAALAAEERAR